MNTVVLGVIVLILFAVVEQLVARLLAKTFPENSRVWHPVALIVALITLATFAVLLQSCAEKPSVTPTPSQNTGLLYQLTIQDNDTQDGIEGAEVVLTVPGVSPFRAITDVNGLAVIENLPDDILGKTAVLTINANNYEPYRLNVAVNLNQLPQLVPLEKR